MTAYGNGYRIKPGLPSSMKGRMSFAVVAVIILVMACYTGIYLSSINRRNADIIKSGADLKKLELAGNALGAELESGALGIASACVYKATQLESNASLIDGYFSKEMSRYLKAHFPFNSDDIKIDVTGYSIGIYPRHQKTMDVVESGRGPKSSGISKTCSEKTHPNTIVSGEYLETSVISGYSLSGYFNATLTSITSAAIYNTTIAVERVLATDYPFIKDKMETLKAGASGPSKDIGRLIKYILTTIAQFRVLQGYGSGKIDGLSAKWPDHKTSEIIKPSDVELAVNIAVILMVVKLYRTYDIGALRSFDKNHQLSGGNAAASPIEKIISRWVTNGTVDAADIVALYLGYDKEKLAIDQIIAQGLNVMADQFILKYMDYLGVTEFADGVFRGAQSFAQRIDDGLRTVHDYFNSLLYGDVDKDYHDWLHNSLEKSSPDGLDIENGDFLTNVCRIDIQTDCGQIAILKNQHHKHNLDDDSDLEDVYWEMKFFYKVKINADDYEIVFEKNNAFRDFSKESVIGALWEEYKNIYKDRNKDIYDSISSCIKSIIKHISTCVVAEVFKNDGKYQNIGEINPNDENNLIHDLMKKTDNAVEQIQKYYSGDDGKQKIKELIGKISNIERTSELASLRDFIIKNIDTIAGKDERIEKALEKLKTYIMDNDKYEFKETARQVTKECSAGDHDKNVVQPSFSELVALAEKDINWNVRLTPFVEHAYIESCKIDFNKMNKSLDSAMNAETDDKIIGFFISPVTDLIDGLGLIPMACSFIKRVTSEILSGYEITNTLILETVRMGSAFEFGDGNRTEADTFGHIGEFYKVDQKPDYLSASTLSRDIGGLQVVMNNPTGTHYTNLTDVNYRPFETTWHISIKGKVNLKISSSNLHFMVNGVYKPTTCSDNITIDVNVPITVYSGWGLDGIDYTPSATLYQDIMNFLNSIWNQISGFIGELIDGIMKVINFFADIINTLIRFAAEIVKFISDIVQFIVGVMQSALSSILSAIIDILIGFAPNNSRMELAICGFTLGVSKQIPDRCHLPKSIKDALAVSFGYSSGWCDFSFDVIFLKFDGKADVILDTVLTIGNTQINMLIDPLMLVLPRIVDVRGTSANGWRLDFFMPDVSEEYIQDNFAVSCGVVDIGLEVKFRNPSPPSDRVYINEFDSNPRSGNPWFEIYNPNKILIRDWSVSLVSSGEEIKLSTLTPRTDAGGAYIVYELEGRVMESGIEYNPRDITKLRVGDGIVLRKPDGSIADSTPIMRDSAKNSSSWQRRYDCSNAWVFREHTPCTTNGRIDTKIKETFKAIVNNCMQTAVSEWLGDISDPEGIPRLVKRFIRGVVDNITSEIENVVMSATFYIDVKPSGAVGFRLGFMIDEGKNVAAVLRWIAAVIETYLSNLGNPGQSGGLPSLPRTCMEKMYIVFLVFFDVGVPKYLKKDDGAGTGAGSPRMAAGVFLNVPTLGRIIGMNLGKMHIFFGVCYFGVESSSVSKLLGKTAQNGWKVDIWILKAEIYQI